MAKMTPEREAAYALDFGVARSDLSPEAKLAYDRLAELRARTAAGHRHSGAGRADITAAGCRRPVPVCAQPAVPGLRRCHRRAGAPLSRWVLFAYAAAFLAITVWLAHWVEDPSLSKRFGDAFETYRRQVPGSLPRWPRRSS